MFSWISKLFKKNKDMVILIDNGHGSNTKGKHSPDNSLKEFACAREIASMIYMRLKLAGYTVELVTPEKTDVPLVTRVRRVNEYCKKYGSKNCVLVSVHNNAAGGDGKWHDAKGWSVFVSKNASSNSKKLAAIMTDLAIKENLMGNRSVPKEKYWTWSWTTKDIYILKNTNCPAVLTENMFQDNKEDVEFLLTTTGKAKIADIHVKGIIEYIKEIS